MDLTDSGTAITVVSGLAILVGLFGIAIPMVPGLILCWLGVLFWAIFGSGGGWGRWLVFAIATAIVATGTVVKYAWPGRALKRSGVPNSSLLAGGVLGLVGFFVVPVVGLVLGFVLGIWLAERTRLGDAQSAWPSTRNALKAAGLAMLIEMGAGLTVAAAWVVGVLTAG